MTSKEIYLSIAFCILLPQNKLVYFQTLSSIEICLLGYYLLNKVFSRMFQLLCSFYSCNILYINKIPSIRSLIFKLNFTMFFNIVLLHRITNVYQELMAIHSWFLIQKWEHRTEHIRSRLSAYPARNLCRRRRLESRSTPVGIADAILWRLTVCTIQRAWRTNASNFMRAKFITGPRCSCIIGTIWLTLSQSPGVVVTFMEKAAKLFFKVTNFQGLLQEITN